jgi:hypothetical protein
MISSKYVAIKPGGEQLLLTIELGVPELDPTSDAGDYRCKISVSALGLEQYVYGVDAIQAYCMVLKRLKMLFEERISEGWTFYFPGYPDMEVDILSSYF